MLERHLQPVYVAASTTATAPTGQFFRAFTVFTVTSTIAVKGGISQALDANDAPDGNTFLANQDTPTDQKTGVNLNGTHDAGVYEMIPTVALDLAVPAGTTVYGRFTEIACGSGDVVMAYM